MALATWWTSDPLIELPPVADFQAQLAVDDLQMAAINQITVAEVKQRRRAGHRPYVGLMDGTAVTYGWVATCEASIGELNLVFPITADSRHCGISPLYPNGKAEGCIRVCCKRSCTRSERNASGSSMPRRICRRAQECKKRVSKVLGSFHSSVITVWV